MKTRGHKKSLQSRYTAKFKRELGEGIAENAIISMIAQMHHVGQINFRDASIITDCLAIAKSELRKETTQRGATNHD